MPRINTPLALAAALAFFLINVYTNFGDDNESYSPRNIRRILSDYDIQQFADEEYFREQDLRIVSLGSSRAWGTGMDDPAKESFTGLLGGVNKAIRASNPDYPAMCMYSMIGDDVYDVILIEYMPQAYDGTRESLLQMGRRLRQRFPDALIVYLNIWTNRQFYQKNEDGTKTDLYLVLDKEGREAGGAGREVINVTTFERVLKKTKEDDFVFLDSNEGWLREAVKDPSIDGIMINYELPNEHNYLNSMMEVWNFYINDMIHFSKFGHQWIRHQVMKLVREKLHTRSDNINPWESMDQCISWFQSGELEDNIVSNMPMKDFADKSGQKYSLEASNPSINFIEVENNNNQTQHLYLSHMSTGPKDYYGGGVVEIREKNIANNSSLTVDVSTLETWSSFPIHVMVHYYIGEIPKGKFYIMVRGNLTEGNRPFRTTGLIITPSNHTVGSFTANLD